MTKQPKLEELEFLKNYFEDRLSFSKIGIKPVVYIKTEKNYEVYFEFFLNIPDGNAFTGMSSITIPGQKINGFHIDSVNDFRDVCWFN